MLNVGRPDFLDRHSVMETIKVIMLTYRNTDTNHPEEAIGT